MGCINGKRKLRKNTGLLCKRFLIQILMLVLTLIAIIPVYVTLINATRSVVEINSGFSLLPGKNILNNWRILTEGALTLWRGFVNSAIISISATFVCIYFSAMTAYGLHVYKFKGRTVVWTVILINMMLPGSIVFIGFYQLMVRLNLLNNYIPLIFPGIAAGTIIFFIRQYMKAVLSVDLLDATRLDGAGEFLIFNRIIIPIIVPSLAAMAIFVFVGSWNNFFMPFVLISDIKKYTLPMMVMTLNGNIYNAEMGGIYLGLSISLLPILIFYSFMSRFIISGIAMGSINE